MPGRLDRLAAGAEVGNDPPSRSPVDALALDKLRDQRSVRLLRAAALAPGEITMIRASAARAAIRD
jgi:hypothetical protein